MFIFNEVWPLNFGFDLRSWLGRMWTWHFGFVRSGPSLIGGIGRGTIIRWFCVGKRRVWLGCVGGFRLDDREGRWWCRCRRCWWMGPQRGPGFNLVLGFWFRGVCGWVRVGRSEVWYLVIVWLFVILWGGVVSFWWWFSPGRIWWVVGVIGARAIYFSVGLWEMCSSRSSVWVAH